MPGFNDVIEQALPYLTKEKIEATQGTTWQWSYALYDNSNALVDMTSGYTATMNVVNGSGAPIISPTVTFPSAGFIKCVATPNDTAPIAPGKYFHELTITRTSDSAKVVVVGAGGGVFEVKKKVS